MCGIIFYKDDETLDIYSLLNEISHRGPDHSSYTKVNDYVLGHTRLSINGVESGSQPIRNEIANTILSVNGEIYNHTSLEEKWGKNFTGSDCDVLSYISNPNQLKDIKGMFAFVLYNVENGDYLITRDRFGIIPLYYGYSSSGKIMIASELKVFPKDYNIKIFPPGEYLTNKLTIPRKYTCKIDYFNELYTDEKQLFKEIYTKLYNSVKSHLMSEVEYGVLLSGGLDSTIILSLVVEIYKELNIPINNLKTFSIGMKVKGENVSKDVVIAEKVAQDLGTDHTTFYFTPEEGIKSLDKVIYHIETYDTTTIRASTPMFLLGKKIKEKYPSVKVVLSGEGADELFAGYLYFKKAPNAIELFNEVNDKVYNLHYYDCLRANKSMMANGIEVRVPFLDTDFAEFALSINPIHKECNNSIEKRILRETFKDIIPDYVYTRQKDQFSDAVSGINGVSWIDSVKDYADKIKFNIEHPFNKPRTQEERLYREIYLKFFDYGTLQLTPWGFSSACSTPRVEKWCKSLINDPSGRVLEHYI